MSIPNPPNWNPPLNRKSNLQITPAETTKLTPKRKCSNPSPSPLPWNWNWGWNWAPSLLPSLLPSPLLSPLSTYPIPAECIPSFDPNSWLSAANSILHSIKAKEIDVSPENRPILRSLEDAVRVVNDEITDIETVVEEMRCWGSVSLREAVEIVEEAESNIWVCLDRVRAEIAERHIDEKYNRVREAIHCLLVGDKKGVNALLEGIND